MTKKDNYILITWYWDTSSDYESHHSFETVFEFVSEKQLDDIKSLMRDNSIKQWVKDPESVTAKTYKDGDACLVQYRNVTIKPVKIVESWSYQPEQINAT